jgi:hypothetical protein
MKASDVVKVQHHTVIRPQMELGQLHIAFPLLLGKEPVVPLTGKLSGWQTSCESFEGEKVLLSLSGIKPHIPPVA